MLPVDNQVQEVIQHLYEINDDPKRKEFLDDLFSFMQKRGTPINRLPIMAKSVLDLYELYNLVIARGGLVDVINKKLWQEIIKGLHLPSSITSAAFTLRTQYMKYLYPYECEKKNLSNPSELQAAIDGNRREGRRSSYGQFDPQIQNQLQMSQVQRSPVSSGIPQISPLSLVTHGGANQNTHRHLMGGAAPPVGQMPNLVPHDFEQRMMEYIKLFQAPKEPRRSQSPESMSTREALNALEMSRVALWNMYSNNTSPPTSSINNNSPPSNDQQRCNNHAFPENHAIKRERDIVANDYSEHDFAQPPAKRVGFNPTSMAASLAQSNLNELLAAAGVSNGNVNGGNRHPRSVHDDDEDVNEEDDMDDEHNNDGLYDAVQNKMRPSPLHHHLVAMNHVKAQYREKPSNAADYRKSVEQQHHSEDEEDQEHHDSANALPNIFGGLQFKVIKTGISDSGDSELVVTMEINNVTYEGTLFASKKNGSKHHSKSRAKDSASLITSPVKSTTSTGSSAATTTQLVSPSSKGSNNNDTDMLNNNCVSKNPNIDLDARANSPREVGDEEVDRRMIGTAAADEDDGMTTSDHEMAEEDLSMKPKKVCATIDDIRVAQAPIVSS